VAQQLEGAVGIGPGKDLPEFIAHPFRADQPDAVGDGAELEVGCFVDCEPELCGQAHCPQHAHRVGGEAPGAGGAQPACGEVLLSACRVDQAGGRPMLPAQGHGIDRKISFAQVVVELVAAHGGDVADQGLASGGEDQPGHIAVGIQGIAGPAEPVGCAPGCRHCLVRHDHIQVIGVVAASQQQVSHLPADDVDSVVLAGQRVQQCGEGWG
jgi:hypothetical protein